MSFSATWADLTWSPWLPFNASLDQFRNQITTRPGVYRVRAIGIPDLVYVGQTGRNLRERTRALISGVNRASTSPPWNDPHTAAPILWAYRHEDQFEYEFSVAALETDKANRQCIEDSLLYLHRKEHGHSTLCNHGRLHPRWTRASNKKFGRSTQRLDHKESYESLKPAIGNEDFLSTKWLDLNWSEPCSLDTIKSSNAGVYRIINGTKLAYIGESKMLASRIKTHGRNPHFADCAISVHEMPDAFPHQLKEREVDLIGAYYLKTQEPPLFQYRPKL